MTMLHLLPALIRKLAPPRVDFGGSATPGTPAPRTAPAAPAVTPTTPATASPTR